jgi:DNA-binding NtrC family response regulator
MRTVLIIEDNLTLSDFTARVLGDQLEDLEVEIVTALSCRHARAAIKKHDPKVCIVDRHLPDGNGLDIVSDMVKEGFSCHWILVSAETIHALPPHIYAVLGKPFEVQELAGAVRKALEGDVAGGRRHSQLASDGEINKIDTHLIKNRLSGLLAGLRAFGSDIRAEAENPEAVVEAAEFYVDRLCSTVMDISKLLGEGTRK